MCGPIVFTVRDGLAIAARFYLEPVDDPASASRRQHRRSADPVLMFLVAGGTGRLGSRVVELLEAGGASVRALSRHVDGDLRDITDQALAGVSVAVSCVTGFPARHQRAWTWPATSR